RHVGPQLVEQLGAHGGERTVASTGPPDLERCDVLGSAADAHVVGRDADPEGEAAGAPRGVAIAARVAVDALLGVRRDPILIEDGRYEVEHPLELAVGRPRTASRDAERRDDLLAIALAIAAGRAVRGALVALLGRLDHSIPAHRRTREGRQGHGQDDRHEETTTRHRTAPNMAARGVPSGKARASAMLVPAGATSRARRPH